jgi:hypothetical protein
LREKRERERERESASAGGEDFVRRSSSDWNWVSSPITPFTMAGVSLGVDSKISNLILRK